MTGNTSTAKDKKTPWILLVGSVILPLIVVVLMMAVENLNARIVQTDIACKPTGEIVERWAGNFTLIHFHYMPVTCDGNETDIEDSPFLDVYARSKEAAAELNILCDINKAQKATNCRFTR